MVRPAASPAKRPAPPPAIKKAPANKAPPKKSGTSSKPQSKLPSSSNSKANGSKQTNGVNAAALAGPAAMAARRELNGALRTQDAFKKYGNLTADSFAGPDDIRLRQLNRAATQQNVGLTRQLNQAAKANGLDDAMIYGRAKTPFSMFGKLREAPGTTVSSMKDMSGARIDVKPTKPGFGQFYEAQDVAKKAVGDGLKLKQDYIKNPNRWGYTGRIHNTVDGAKGLTHELQVGSRDLSKFIDKKLVTAGGDAISLHDATGYKGEIYGAKLPKEMNQRYTDLMGKITEANKSGKSVSQVPKLQAELDDFYGAVQKQLPKNLKKPPVELSKTAKAGNLLGKGMGALGVVGGGFQVANGVDNLKNGKKVEGSADVVAGSGSIISGAALMTGRVALGTTTGGAVAVVDGAKDIYTGIRDGNVEKAATGGVKTAAGGAMIAGVATANPVLIAGGAIAYGGAVIYENRKAIANGAKKAWGWAKSWF